MVLQHIFMFARSAYSDAVNPKKKYLPRNPVGKLGWVANGRASVKF
jgi:hypothetical protein